MRDAMNKTVDATCDAILDAVERFDAAVEIYRRGSLQYHFPARPEDQLRRWFECPALHTECAYLLDNPSVTAQEYALMLLDENFERPATLAELIARIK